MLLVLVTVAGTVGFVGVLQGVLKSAPPFQMAVERAQKNPTVIAALGEPIESGWFVNGEVHEAFVSAVANLSGQLTGSKGKASLTVHGKRTSGVWHLTIIVVVKGTGQRIDLSDPPARK